MKVQVGDLISAGTSLTTVTKVDPMKAYFTVSEQRFSEYSRRYADPEELSKHEKESRFELILADGTVYPNKGELFAKDNQVDVRTGSLRIAALFPNLGNVLRPGQFARIRVLSEMKPGALLVPQRAVSELQGTNQVAIVGPDNKVHIQPVKMGRRVDHDWIVEEGLKAGDKIVHDGKEVGHITSAVKSPALNTNIALGYVRREANQIGSELTLRSAGIDRPVKIVDLPFA